CDRHHPAGEGRSRAAAGAAPGPCGVVRVEGLTEHLVVGLGTRAELGGVGLANGNGARATQALDDYGVLFGDEVLVEGGAERRAASAGRGEVLVGHRQPVERADFLTVRDRLDEALELSRLEETDPRLAHFPLSPDPHACWETMRSCARLASRKQAFPIDCTGSRLAPELFPDSRRTPLLRRAWGRRGHPRDPYRGRSGDLGDCVRVGA